ncbi:unnamed protein product, partial [Prorocentrum cordatum]
ELWARHELNQDRSQSATREKYVESLKINGWLLGQRGEILFQYGGQYKSRVSTNVHRKFRCIGGAHLIEAFYIALRRDQNNKQLEATLKGGVPNCTEIVANAPKDAIIFFKDLSNTLHGVASATGFVQLYSKIPDMVDGWANHWKAKKKAAIAAGKGQPKRRKLGRKTSQPEEPPVPDLEDADAAGSEQADPGKNSETDQWAWLQRAFPKTFSSFILYKRCRALKAKLSIGDSPTIWDNFEARMNATCEFTDIGDMKLHEALMAVQCQVVLALQTLPEKIFKMLALPILCLTVPSTDKMPFLLKSTTDALSLQMGLLPAKVATQGAPLKAPAAKAKAKAKAAAQSGGGDNITVFEDCLDIIERCKRNAVHVGETASDMAIAYLVEFLVFKFTTVTVGSKKLKIKTYSKLRGALAQHCVAAHTFKEDETHEHLRDLGIGTDPQAGAEGEEKEAHEDVKEEIVLGPAPNGWKTEELKLICEFLKDEPNIVTDAESLWGEFSMYASSGTETFQTIASVTHLVNRLSKAMQSVWADVTCPLGKQSMLLADMGEVTESELTDCQIKESLATEEKWMGFFIALFPIVEPCIPTNLVKSCKMLVACVDEAALTDNQRVKLSLALKDVHYVVAEFAEASGDALSTVGFLMELRAALTVKLLEEINSALKTKTKSNKEYVFISLANLLKSMSAEVAKRDFCCDGKKDWTDSWAAAAAKACELLKDEEIRKRQAEELQKEREKNAIERRKKAEAEAAAHEAAQKLDLKKLTLDLLKGKATQCGIELVGSETKTTLIEAIVNHHKNKVKQEPEDEQEHGAADDNTSATFTEEQLRLFVSQPRTRPGAAATDGTDQDQAAKREKNIAELVRVYDSTAYPAITSIMPVHDAAVDRTTLAALVTMQLQKLQAFNLDAICLKVKAGSSIADSIGSSFKPKLFVDYDKLDWDAFSLPLKGRVVCTIGNAGQKSFYDMGSIGIDDTKYNMIATPGDFDLGWRVKALSPDKEDIPALVPHAIDVQLKVADIKRALDFTVEEGDEQDTCALHAQVLKMNPDFKKEIENMKMERQQLHDGGETCGPFVFELTRAALPGEKAAFEAKVEKAKGREKQRKAAEKLQTEFDEEAEGDARLSVDELLSVAPHVVKK